MLLRFLFTSTWIVLLSGMRDAGDESKGLPPLISNVRTDTGPIWDHLPESLRFHVKAQFLEDNLLLHPSVLFGLVKDDPQMSDYVLNSRNPFIQAFIPDTLIKSMMMNHGDLLKRILAAPNLIDWKGTEKIDPLAYIMNLEKVPRIMGPLLASSGQKLCPFEDLRDLLGIYVQSHVIKFLETGFSNRVPNRIFLQLLEWTCYFGKVDLVRQLFVHLGNQERLTEGMMTFAFNVAASNYQLQVIKLLNESPFRTFITQKAMHHALFTATFHQHASVIELLDDLRDLTNARFFLYLVNARSLAHKLDHTDVFEVLNRLYFPGEPFEP